MRCIFSPRSIHGSLVASYVDNWAETVDNENRQGGGALLEVFFVGQTGGWEIGLRAREVMGGE